jgi:hypothetical protein
MYKYILEIIKLYVYLLIFIYLVSIFFKIHVIFSYTIILLILWFINYDERKTGWRYFMFVLIVLVHVIILKEGWYKTKILIIQDMFWYSLLMLGSFIWHVLILNWLYKVCEKVGWDYGCYIVSRWSLLTSLTIVL